MTDDGRVLVRTYYRALTAGGSLWIESKSLDEVREACDDGDTYEIQQMDVFEVTDGWTAVRGLEH